jgi:hypothetical protein
MLLDANAIEQLDRKESDVVALAGPRLQQRTEHRIAVEARKTRPGDLGLGVDERSDGPVPDQREIQ